jgi:hypothetical protein
MVIDSGQSGYSADVRMRLLLNGASVPLAQLGPDFVLVDAPVEHGPCEATIVVTIDGQERRWTVRLPAGMSAGSKTVVIAPVS